MPHLSERIIFSALPTISKTFTHRTFLTCIPPNLACRITPVRLQMILMPAPQVTPPRTCINVNPRVKLLSDRCINEVIRPTARSVELPASKRCWILVGIDTSSRKGSDVNDSLGFRVRRPGKKFFVVGKVSHQLARVTFPANPAIRSSKFYGLKLSVLSLTELQLSPTPDSLTNRL